ncbi:MAG: hypothetical protein HKN46_03360 [Acidimicrobiia bacterium]|nr:hypothetical protein [Acidimicrobiia bacterium]
MHRASWVLGGAAAAAAIYGPTVDSAFTWFYVPLSVVYAGLIEWLDRRLGLRERVRWSLTVAALGNLAAGVLVVGGDQFYVYPLFGPVWVDDVQHFTAAAIASWAAWDLLRALPERSRAFVAVLTATGLGALIEVGEFIGWSLFDTNVGGYTDTMMDFVVNLAGATLAGVVSFVRSSAERERPTA